MDEENACFNREKKSVQEDYKQSNVQIKAVYGQGIREVSVRKVKEFRKDQC